MKYLSIAILFVLPFSLLSQYRFDYQWPFGYADDIPLGFGISTLDFNNDLVEVEAYQEVDEFRMGHSGSFICNEEGQIKLMTNNCEIVDANFNIIEEGMEITPGVIYDDYCPGGGYPSNQCTLFLPEMSNDSVTYLVHKDLILSSELQSVLSEQLFLSIIVEKQDGTFYVKDKLVLIEDSQLVSSRLTGVSNSSLDKWWIWVLSYDSNSFYKFLIGGEEIVEGPFIQEIGPEVSSADFDIGQAAFSPNAEYLAINSETYGVMLYDFDAQSGTLSNYRSIEYPGMEKANGLVFSPNSRFIYADGLHDIYQIDLQSDTGDSEVVHLGNLLMEDINGWVVSTGMMYLGPDCRLYISPSSTSRVIHVIHQPNEKGLACEVEQGAIRTPTRVDIYLPNLPMYRFGGSCDSTIAWGIVSEVEEPEEEEVGAWLAPNPANSYSTLFLPARHSCRRVAIINAQGQMITALQLAAGQRRVQVDTKSLAPGLYWLRLDTTEKQILKLVVQR